MNDIRIQRASTSQAAAVMNDVANTFRALCQVRAERWQLREMALQEAVDWLQEWVSRYDRMKTIGGQDAVQAIMSEVFATVGRKCCPAI